MAAQAAQLERPVIGRIHKLEIEMQCERCDGEVTWRGPFSALTHTECGSCGGINCQRVTPQDDPDDCGNTPYDEGPFTLGQLPDNAMYRDKTCSTTSDDH